MTKVACGVNWSFGDDGVPNEGTESEILAKDLVCKANKFTNLVIYKDNVLIPNYSISKNIRKPKKSISRNTDDDYSQLLIEINDTNENDFSVVVPPNKDEITSEGPMEWPGIITASDIKEHNLLIAYTSICVSIEETVRTKVMETTKYLKYKRFDKDTGEEIREINGKKKSGQFPFSQTSDRGIGTLAKYFRGENARRDAKERGKAILQIYNPKNTFEETFKTGVSRADYKLTWIADMRNKLAHGAISIKEEKVHDKIICLEKIKWMYEIAKGLKIL